AATGLASPDVFYFGNAIGETGNSATDATVKPTDEIGARNNTRTLGGPEGPAGIEDVYARTVPWRARLTSARTFGPEWRSTGITRVVLLEFITSSKKITL
ncbi:MAG: hypothetical protein SVV80_12185, partial [Planctomycetota bacterium]|nr:hypothetical protein [Planctomycetota bacterium]